MSEIQEKETTPSVLFVCLGNICRSPMAEGALRAAAERAGLDILIDSCGTASYHIGNSPDPRAIATAAKNGVDISHLSARQLTEEDFWNYTHIFALDTANLAGIRGRQPRGSSAEVAMLLDVIPGREGETVMDPYYGDDGGFDVTWDDVSAAADAIVSNLKS